MYITNIQEKIKGTISDARNDGKNSSENEDKKLTVRTRPLEKSCPINPNDDLNDYGESGIENNQERKKEWKKVAKKMKEVIHIEFNTDDDKKVQIKNAKDRNTEGKVQIKKKMIHYYEFSSKDKSRNQAQLKKFEKTQR